MPYPDDRFGRELHAYRRRINRLVVLDEQLSSRSWPTRLLAHLRLWWWRRSQHWR